MNPISNQTNQTNRAPNQKHENQTAQLPSLIAGELSPMRAFLLRRHVNNCPECARELTEMTALWGELKNLQALPTAKPAPLWPIADPPEKRPVVTEPIFALAGLNLKRRTAFAVCAALTLTGAVAARQCFYRPSTSPPAGNGLNRRGASEIRGEVRSHDANNDSNDFIRSVTEEDLPATATVEIGGERIDLHGAGVHTSRSQDGAIFGVADYVPQTTDERGGWWARDKPQYDIEEPLKMPHGARNGVGKATGFFGAGKNRLEWRFYGAAQIVFRNIVTGKIAFTARAAPLTPELREARRSVLSPEDFAATVAGRVPLVPKFEYSIGGRGNSMMAIFPSTICVLSIPDGPHLQVEVIIPEEQTFSARINRENDAKEKAKSGANWKFLDGLIPTR